MNIGTPEFITGWAYCSVMIIVIVSCIVASDR